MLGYIRGTTTGTGLSVQAALLEGDFPRGEKVATNEMDRVALQPHPVCPDWNYTIEPRAADDEWTTHGGRVAFVERHIQSTAVQR